MNGNLQTETNYRGNQTRAGVTMLIAVLGYSLIPLLVDSSRQISSLVLLAGTWYLAESLVRITIYYILGRETIMSIIFSEFKQGSQEKYDLNLHRANSTNIMRTIPNWMYPALTLFSASWVLYAWSARFVETAVTSVIVESWPFLFLLIRGYISGLGEKRKATIGELVLVALAAVSLAMVIFSNGSSGAVGSNALLGIVSALLSLVMVGGGTALQVRCGELVADQILGTDRSEKKDQSEKIRRAIFKTRVTMLALVAVRLPVGIALLAIGLFSDMSPKGVSLTQFAVAFGLGATVAVSSLFLFLANHLSSTDTVNSLSYAVPAVALIWLWLMTEVAITNISLFISGVIGIVAINMVLHLDPEGTGTQKTAADEESLTSGHGFRAFVLALWMSGAFVVLRDQWLPESMLRWSSGEYWGGLALVTTVFVFILSFRQSRLAERENEADVLVLDALAEIETLRVEEIFSEDRESSIITHLNSIDRGRTASTIGLAYLNLRSELLPANDEEPPREYSRKRRLLLNVEKLTNLRQKGREITGLLVLGLFGALGAFVALLIRPVGASGLLQGWEGFATEVVAMCVAAAVTFLVFELVDLRRLRDAPRLRWVSPIAAAKFGQRSGWRLNLLSYSDEQTKEARASRVVAIGLATAVLTAFVILLRYKWVGS